MARHGAPQTRRGIAGWIVAVAVAVVVVVVAVVVFVIVNRSNSDNASACTTTSALPVTTTPDIAGAVQAAADAFNQTHPVLRSACVTAKVDAADSASTVKQLAAAGGTQGPALWLTTSGAAVDQVDPTIVAGRSTSPIAQTPVVLAVRTSDAATVLGLPTGEFSWNGLPALRTSVLPSGDWRLGLSRAADSPAVGAALQSIVAGTRGSGTAAVSIEDVTHAAAKLAAVKATVVDAGATTADALAALQSGTAQFSAVPAYESQVAEAVAAGATGVTAVYPAGVNAAAQVFTVPITAGWVDDTQKAAAAAFESYLTSSAGETVLVTHGLRVPGASPSSAVAGVNMANQLTIVPPADPDVVAALDATVTDSTAPTTPSSQSAGSSAPQSVPPISTPSGGGASASPGSPSPPVSSSGIASSPSTSGPAGTTTKSSTSSSTSSSESTSSAASSTSTSTSTSSSTSTSTSASTPAPNGPVVTFLVDSSDDMGSSINGKSLLDWVKSSMADYLKKYPNSDVGLYQLSTTNDTAGYDQPVTTGPLTEKVGATTRAASLTAALNAFTPGGDCWAYGALQTGYARAAQNPVAGRKNFVVLITASPDGTPSLSRTTLISSISGAAASATTPVVLDVVGLSDNVSSTAYDDITQAGGGDYSQVAPTDLSGWLTDPARFG